MDKLSGGIDLHANNSVVVVLDEQDQVRYHKRLPNELEKILQQLAPFRTQLQGLVVESTYNWYWLVDGLQEVGYVVHLANPAAMQQYAGLKYTNDDTDARWLAHLLRLGLLPTGYIYPKEERAVRDLLRKRSQLVRQKTANLLSIQNLLTRNTGKAMRGNQIKQLTPVTVSELVPFRNKPCPAGHRRRDASSRGAHCRDRASGPCSGESPPSVSGLTDGCRVSGRRWR